MKTCQKCGSTMQEDALVCPSCGNPAYAGGQNAGGAYAAPAEEMPHQKSGPYPVPTPTAYPMQPQMMYPAPGMHIQQAPQPPFAQPAGQRGLQPSAPFPVPAAVAPPSGALPGKSTQSAGRWFCENILGLLVLGLIFLFTVAIWGFIQIGTGFGGEMYMVKTLSQIGIALPPVLGFVLTTRACGPDFSLGTIAVFGAGIYALTGSVLLCLLFGILIGAVNGCLLYFLRLPAIITTLAVAGLLSGVGALLFYYEPLMLESGGVRDVLLILVGLAALAGCFAYHFFTPLGLPIAQKKQRPRSLAQLAAYPTAAVLAVVAGIFTVANAGVFLFQTTAVVDNLVLLFVWAALMCSRLFDNRVAPVLVGLLAVFVCRILLQTLWSTGFSPSIVPFLYGGLTLVVLIVAGISRWPFGKKQSMVVPDEQGE